MSEALARSTAVEMGKGLDSLLCEGDCFIFVADTNQSVASSLEVLASFHHGGLLQTTEVGFAGFGCSPPPDLWSVGN